MATAQDPKIPDDRAPQTTASGLKYSVLVKGQEGPHPKLGDTVKVRYTGWLTSGKVFDASPKSGEPASFKVGRLIEGWNEALQLMTPGARFKLTVPPKLAYGSRPPPGMPPDATLVFELELVSVKPGPALPVFHPGNPQAQKSTPSGLKYEVLKAGQGERPGKDERFAFKYALWTVKGKLLDSSELQPRNPRGVCGRMRLEFFNEAMPLLKTGARYRFEVPPKLCFKDRAQGPDLPPNSATVWELELVRILRPLPVPKFSRSPKEKLKTTPSGLQYEVIRKGTGTRPKRGQQVSVHYAGWLTDGKLFDSSFARGDTATFRLGEVIPGWTEGLQLMREGAIYKFTIPGKLAYGPTGAPRAGIGPDATLIFHVELQRVLD